MKTAGSGSISTPTSAAACSQRAAFLTVLSTANVTAPIRRGVWILEQAMCNELGDPPPNANDTPVEGGEVDGELRTVRDDVTARTTEGTCAACHNQINPIGFAFENYDAIGRYQTEEVTSGLSIDATGYLAGTGDVDGAVSDGLDMSQKLSASEKVRGCFADRWFEQAIGHSAGDMDACSRDAIVSRFVETGSIRELFIAIVESDAFRHKSHAEEDSQ